MPTESTTTMRGWGGQKEIQKILQNKSKNNNSFKKLKLKKRKGKTPQNCKSPTYRQRFITTIKNVTEGEKKLN